MCGRYSETRGLSVLAKRFRLDDPKLDFAPRYNLAPSQAAPVVTNEGGRKLELLRWGLIPSWAKDAAIGHKMINARGETVAEKPSYRRPFAKRRCLVLADGFYEWKRDAAAKTKTPMRVTLKSGEPFAMAGLWDSWKDPAGKEVRSFTIITTSPNGVMAPIHDRMPVIVRPQDEDLWLDPASKPERLLPLLVPYPDAELTAFAVSALVNSPANDVPACLQPA